MAKSEDNSIDPIDRLKMWAPDLSDYARAWLGQDIMDYIREWEEERKLRDGKV